MPLLSSPARVVIMPAAVRASIARTMLDRASFVAVARWRASDSHAVGAFDGGAVRELDEFSARRGAGLERVRRGASRASDNTYYVYYVTGTKEGPRLREVCLGPREEIVESRLLITGRDGPRLRCYVHRLHHRSGGLHRRSAGLRLRRWAGRHR